MKRPQRKPKPRQQKLKGWVAVPSDLLALDKICAAMLGNACREFLCGKTKAEVLEQVRIKSKNRVIVNVKYSAIHLDIVATVR